MSSEPLLVPEEFVLLKSCLQTVQDPRHRRGVVHPLIGVLSLVVLGLMAGCRSLSAIHRWAELHPDLLQALGLRRSPSVATLGRLLRLVKVAQVRAALRSFAQGLFELRQLALTMTVAVDGKIDRGVRENGQQLGLVHLFAHEAKLALDQVAAVQGEVGAIQQWIEQLAGQFPGLAVLTGDALFAQRDLCTAIVAQGKDYMVKLKKTSQPSMKK